jgi:hypothetical protein
MTAAADIQTDILAGEPIPGAANVHLTRPVFLDLIPTSSFPTSGFFTPRR